MAAGWREALCVLLIESGGTLTGRRVLVPEALLLLALPPVGILGSADGPLLHSSVDKRVTPLLERLRQAIGQGYGCHRVGCAELFQLSPFAQGRWLCPGCAKQHRPESRRQRARRGTKSVKGTRVSTRCRVRVRAVVVNPCTMPASDGDFVLDWASWLAAPLHADSLLTK